MAITHFTMRKAAAEIVQSSRSINGDAVVAPRSSGHRYRTVLGIRQRTLPGPSAADHRRSLPDMLRRAVGTSRTVARGHLARNEVD